MSKRISEFTDGLVIETQFLVSGLSRGVKADGSRYLNVTLQDSSGQIEGKKWDVADEDLNILASGNVVSVYGEVYQYKDKLQFKIFEARPVALGDVDIARFVKECPVPKEELKKKADAYIESIKDPDLKKMVVYLIDQHKADYYDYPAAVRNHHAFASGLLYHSVTMADIAEALCKIYPNLNRDYLIAGTLIHDIGKITELSGPVATKFTFEGRMLGHISIMQAEVREAAHALGLTGEMPILLEHMVLSHHGVPEFGSPVVPETREAMVLNMIDNLDAKMLVLDKALEGVAPGEWSQKIYALDDAFYYNPLYNKKED